MNKQLLRDALGWGFLLWLIGYAFGIILHFAVPSALIGWIIMPIGIFITLWVLYKKVGAKTLGYYFLLSIVWTLIAIAFDYVFIVKMFESANDYYRLDVYIYYITTFLLPLIVGWANDMIN